MKKNENTVRIVKEVFFMMVIYLVVLSVPVLIFTENKLKGEGGLIAGAIVGGLMFYSMYYTIDRAVHMAGKTQVYMGAMSALRLLIVAGFLFVVGWWQFLNIFTTLLGIMGLKVAAYLQPFADRLWDKHNKKKDEIKNK